MPIVQVRKRDGRIVKFEQEKIAHAIFNAAKSVGGGDFQLAQSLSQKVVDYLETQEKKIPSVEDVQDAVEKMLIENGHAKTAKAYILYRQKRKEIREAKELLGVYDDVKLSVQAIKILQRRYLEKDRAGKVIETPGEMLRRVARNVSKADKKYSATTEEIKKTEETFFEMMKNLEFLPNSPTLMNAGKESQILSACFCLPIDDNMESIFDTLKQAALIHQSGGGVGFSFSRLRPKGDSVKSSGGVAAGPVSFLKIFNLTTESIKQGGVRQGANMGILRVDHPDIIEFIILKEKQQNMVNFNMSVALTDKFMKAVEENKQYNIINPRTGEVVNKMDARRVFDLIVTMAWKSGDPGVVFIDRMNKTPSNPVPSLGKVEATSSCGELPLLPYESCNMGSINLTKMITEKDDGGCEINWEKLKTAVHNAVHFLDNVIDINSYPMKQIAEITRANRRIGLGVMGFADMLILLKIPYNAEEAVKIAEKVMKFIDTESKEASQNLAKDRGSFPNFRKSIWKKKYKRMRNATTTAIAPTGTISILAGCSSGIEPLFAVSFIRNIMDNIEFIEVNPIFEKLVRNKDFYTETLMRRIAKMGSIQHVEEIPKEIRSLFVTTHDIKPEDHIKVQAAFQKYTDNAVSKTVNIPNEATTEDVENIYMTAYKMGCKGLTIYRDRSRSEQVVNIELPKK